MSSPGPASFLTDPIFGNGSVRAHFEDAAVLAAMVRVEVALARVQAEMGIIPNSAPATIAELPGRTAVSHETLSAGVAATGVPVPAMVKALRAELSPEGADWLHYGVTSQDIVDTALCLCYSAALDALEQRLSAFIEVLEQQSLTHRDTLYLARTRGQLATPITFGLKVAQWAQPFIRLESEVAYLRAEVLRVQLGGASGSRNVFGDNGEALADRVADLLGLSGGPPWHSDRSGIRRLANWLVRGVEAAAKIGKDVALLARNEIGELRTAQAGGSSTMPHKANPVMAEALQSLGPIALGCEAALAASAVHAEERDGGFWPVEWVQMSMLFETAGAALAHASDLVSGLHIDVEAMRARVESVPETRAEAAVFALAAKVGRIEALRIVGDAVSQGLDLAEMLAEHGEAELDGALSDAAYTKPAARVAAQIFASRRDG
ncbi:MAG: lyase family protein [Pseudomonadota bacterium]